jgi:adenylate cyclase class 2
MEVEPGEPVIENNLVLDLMGGPLRKTDTLFRLRNCEKGTLVTIKRPLPAIALKVRHEEEAVLECSQEDALKLFELLGYGVVYRYEKTRRECRIGEATICLDELWFGRFVEIEAESEEAVMKAVDELGFDPEDGIRFSYAALEKDAEHSGDSREI